MTYVTHVTFLLLPGFVIDCPQRRSPFSNKLWSQLHKLHLIATWNSVAVVDVVELWLQLQSSCCSKSKTGLFCHCGGLAQALDLPGNLRPRPLFGPRTAVLPMWQAAGLFLGFGDMGNMPFWAVFLWMTFWEVGTFWLEASQIWISVWVCSNSSKKEEDRLIVQRTGSCRRITEVATAKAWCASCVRCSLHLKKTQDDLIIFGCTWWAVLLSPDKSWFSMVS